MIKRRISDTITWTRIFKRKGLAEKIVHPISPQSSSEKDSDISIHDDSFTEKTFLSKTLADDANCIFCTGQFSEDCCCEV